MKSALRTPSTTATFTAAMLIAAIAVAVSASAAAAMTAGVSGASSDRAGWRERADRHAVRLSGVDQAALGGRGAVLASGVLATARATPRSGATSSVAERHNAPATVLPLTRRARGPPPDA